MCIVFTLYIHVTQIFHVYCIHTIYSCETDVSKCLTQHISVTRVIINYIYSNNIKQTNLNKMHWFRTIQVKYIIAYKFSKSRHLSEKQTKDTSKH